ncbi:probable salivary secreted peptide [Episyrphus balteatus]|uniref:probable salivary secreted peptide n=1 Tax=Episyrphus balteatus TaxID=286459 RepID=UPI002485E3DD|nr:probable salivary secreted peptide [Episyrphus balteatus]
MKYLGVMAFIAVTATLLAVSEGTNSTWGVVGPRDILLHREIVSLDWKLFRVVTRDVEFYPRNTTRTITAVKAFDITKGSSGNALLKRGGPGFRNATIHLKSQRGRSLHMAVEIIGH